MSHCSKTLFNSDPTPKPAEPSATVLSYFRQLPPETPEFFAQPTHRRRAESFGRFKNNGAAQIRAF
jgi:hypothetical protein